MATLEDPVADDAARTRWPALSDDLDGMTLSKALRAIGFNRDYGASKGNKTIVYARRS